MELNTERLFLRKTKESDYVKFREYYSHPEVSRYLPVEGANNEKSIRAAFDFNLGLEMAFSIIEKKSEQVIGNIHFTNITEGYLAEVGYILNPDFWGLGYMTEALSAANNFAFDCGLVKIRAVCELENKNSIRLLEKNGFIREAVLRDAAFAGRLTDLCYYFVTNNNEKESQLDLFMRLNADMSLGQIQSYVHKILRLRGISEKPIQHSLLLLSLSHLHS